YFTNGRFVPYVPPGLTKRLRAIRMLRDRDGGLWIGTLTQGLMHIHRGRIDTFSQADGLSDNTVLGLFEDREGNVWVATPNGLDRFRPYSIPAISVREGLSTTAAWSVLGAKDGNVWMGTQDGMNKWVDNKISTYGAIDGLPPHSLFEDSSGRIWTSTL